MIHLVPDKWRIIAVAFLIGIITSCKDDANQIGLNLQPDKDKLGVYFNDTTSIISYSEIIDSVRSAKTATSPLGSLYDPVFGITSTAFSTQFRLSKSAFSFGENPQVDSLVLSLKPVSTYGDSNAPFTIRVYELSERIYLDSTYYSNTVIEHSSVLLAEYTMIPNFNDSVVVGGDTLIPHNRISLSNITTEFGIKLLSATDEQMSSADAFQSFFYGIRVETLPVASGGQLASIDLLDDYSKMTLYYKNDEEDSLEYEYLINTNAARFNNFYHDYNAGYYYFKQQVVEGDTTLGRIISYVQPLSGIKTKIFFPYIRDWYKDGSIVINEAKLIIEGVEEDYEFAPPSSLIVAKVTEDGSIVAIEDQLEGTEYYGGYYQKSTNGYFFRVTNYLQNYLNGEDPDYGLELIVDGGAFITKRFILWGDQPQGYPDKRLRLEIKYTKY